MKYTLSPEQTRRYAQDGILQPLPALNVHETAALRAQYETHASILTGRSGRKAYLLHTWLNALVRHPRILDAVESLLGPNLFCWGGQFFAKPVGDIRSMWWIAAKLAEGLDNNLLPAPLTTESSDLDVLGFIAGRAAASFEEIQQRRYIATAPIFGWVLDRVLPGGRWSLVPDELVTQLADWQRITHPKGLLVTSRRQPKHLNSQHIPHHSIHNSNYKYYYHILQN